jgi:hypothetical protein
MRMPMTPDTAQGVSVELSHFLKEGWSFTQEPDRFRVKPPLGSQANADFKNLLEDEVWRIARDVHYRPFVSITKNADGSYTVFSRSDAESAFEILFEAN